MVITTTTLFFSFRLLASQIHFPFSSSFRVLQLGNRKVPLLYRFTPFYSFAKIHNGIGADPSHAERGWLLVMARVADAE